MDSKKTRQLSSEEAKRRLHETMGEMGLHAWVKRRPYEAIAVSFTAGLMLAASKPTRDSLFRVLLKII